MQLTKNQSLLILGISGSSLLASAVAGHIIVKRHDEIVEKHSALREVGMKLGRIAAYQNQLLQEHMVELTGFDRIAFSNMTEDLDICLKHLGYYNDKDKGES